jgi:excisionase family DNA binding protein
MHYSVSEAARQLGVSPSTVRRIIRAGALPAARYGPKGRLRIDPGDLAAFADHAWKWNA